MTRMHPKEEDDSDCEHIVQIVNRAVSALLDVDEENEEEDKMPGMPTEAVLPEESESASDSDSDTVEGPLDHLAQEFDAELLKLAEEVHNVARIQENLSEQMVELQASVLHVREKHRAAILRSEL